MFKQGFLWVGLVVGQSVSAYFITGRIWQKVDSKGNIHTVVGLGDYHIGHKEEENQFVSLMNSIPKNGLIIIEDSVGVEYDAPMLRVLRYRAEYLAENSEKGDSKLLSQIPVACEDVGISFTNIEFRHFDDELVQMIESIKKNRAYVSAQKLYEVLKKFIVTTQDYLKHIHSCSNAHFRQIRDKILEPVTLRLNSLNIFAKFLNDSSQKNKQVTDALIHECMSKNQLSEDIEQLAFEVLIPILDARIMRQLLMRNNRDTFIIAGAAHIRNLEKSMEDLGYRLVKKEGNMCSDNPVSIQEFLSPHYPLIRNGKLTKYGASSLVLISSAMDPRSRKKFVIAMLSPLLLSLAISAVLGILIYQDEQRIKHLRTSY